MTNENQQTDMPEKLGRPGPLQLMLVVIFYILVVGIPVVLVFVASGLDGESSAQEVARHVALAAGVAGLMLIGMQPWLTSRLQCLDRLLGLDTFTRVHKVMAFIGLCLLVLHPLLLTYYIGSGYLFTLQTGWEVWLGKISLLFLIGIVVIAVGFKVVGLNYQTWRFFHKGAIFLLPLALAHGLVIKLDYLPLMIFCALVIAGGVSVFLYRTFLVPFLIRKPFEVQSVEPASVDTHTLRMRPAEGAKFEHYPGQFMFLRLKRPGRKSEEHPFTIASSPTLDGAIEATIKESGDFTNTIGETRTGDTASIEAPFGKFSFVYDQPERILFIAGGVGLTPIISMMRFLRDTSDKRPVFLLYGCRKEEEIVLREELDNMPENMQIQYIMSHPEDDWKGPEGFVNKENIEKLVPDAFLGEETHVYLCGPPPMMNMVIRDLGEVGFGKSRLHYEYFSL